MLCALMGAGSWVLIATRLALPVSTTHAIVGAIIGFGVVAHGFPSIDWTEVGFIVLSWIVSPVLAGLMSASVFYTVRRFILRSPKSLARGFLFYPLLVFVTVRLRARARARPVPTRRPRRRSPSTPSTSRRRACPR
jgi:phosphate/sulfate permease